MINRGGVPLNPFALSEGTLEQFVWTVKVAKNEIDFMDLTIAKEQGFERHGRVETRT